MEHDSLVEQYASMAHAFEPRPIDHVLRAFDILIASVAAFVTLPLALVIGLAVWLSSPSRPILYRGWRVGRGGHLFRMLKFRTLNVDAEWRLGPYLGPQLTALTAGEVTRIGRWLRATKLDELPQL
ncbi:MAG: sugar transferase, partial [Solirubrobacteraceae bacterium]